MKKLFCSFVPLTILILSLLSIFSTTPVHAATNAPTIKTAVHLPQYPAACVSNWEPIDTEAAYAGNNYLGSVTLDMDTCGHLFAIASGYNTIVNHLQFICSAGCSPLSKVFLDAHNGTSVVEADFTPGAPTWVAVKAVFQGRAGWGYTWTSASNGYVYIGE